MCTNTRVCSRAHRGEKQRYILSAVPKGVLFTGKCCGYQIVGTLGDKAAACPVRAPASPDQPLSLQDRCQHCFPWRCEWLSGRVAVICTAIINLQLGKETSGPEENQTSRETPQHMPPLLASPMKKHSPLRRGGVCHLLGHIVSQKETAKRDWKAQPGHEAWQHPASPGDLMLSVICLHT